MASSVTALEWALKPEKLNLPAAALAKIQKTMVASKRPSARLRAAAKRHRR